MKTYVCDMCGNTLKNPFLSRMREITLKKKRTKKRRIHLCESCLYRMECVAQGVKVGAEE